jgi:hypothetical protein
MSIPVLSQVHEETRRLAIAGSSVAAGDFRLKKLIPPLEQAGAKAPVFAKVAEAATKLVESNEKSAPSALLELTSLVSAILYTQGETGFDGEWKEMRSTDLGMTKTQASARVLKPLLEALTTTGSGRMELIKDAHERGAFRDLRLINPALGALDDTYSEISDFVAEKILPLYGPAILPELRAKFDIKGRGGHARRLALMHALDAEGTRELVKQALDEGSKEIRIAAIECLGDAPDDLPFLLEQSKSKAKDVRTAAYKALGASNADSAIKMLCDAIDGANFELAVEPIRAHRSPALTDFLLDAAEKEFEKILGGKEKDKQKLGRLNEHALLVLECLRGRDDKKTEKLLLNLFSQVEKLAAVKGEPSGKDLVERVVSVMATSSAKVQSALIDAHESLPADSLGMAFFAACRSRKPAEVYELFSPYLKAKVNEKKKTDPATQKREVIIDSIGDGPSWRHYYWYNRGTRDEDRKTTFDPKWLDLAVDIEHLELVQSLAVPGHAKANAFLLKQFKQSISKSKEDHNTYQIASTMSHIKHPQATDAVIELIQKFAKGKYGYYYGLGHLITELPKDEAVPKLEALLPSLPEKMIDQLLDYVTQLKNS